MSTRPDKLSKLEWVLVLAIKVALEEFDRMSYQKKARPDVIETLEVALKMADRAQEGRSG